MTLYKKNSAKRQRDAQIKRDNFTSFGVWLSAILCPSNRNLSVLAGTPCKRNTDKCQCEIMASGAVGVEHLKKKQACKSPDSKSSIKTVRYSLW